jgi:hypothetical protein
MIEFVPFSQFAWKIQVMRMMKCLLDSKGMSIYVAIIVSDVSFCGSNHDNTDPAVLYKVLHSLSSGFTWCLRYSTNSQTSVVVGCFHWLQIGQHLLLRVVALGLAPRSTGTLMEQNG